MTGTGQRVANIQAEKQKTYLQTDIEADLQWRNAHREVNKKGKMRPYVLLLFEINK